ncbi:unnamed protein product [Moneuplotes crassus]|uniref:Uncharacterized protein n=1 Tax=Euplotes crassus TaxID=5936 RepID=A0AAD2D1P8_EUPCR|nr:unnamed protein product [Moneuplotes crassus]
MAKNPRKRKHKGKNKKWQKKLEQKREKERKKKISRSSTTDTPSCKRSSDPSKMLKKFQSGKKFIKNLKPTLEEEIKDNNSEVWPKFLLKENIKDAHKHRPDHKEYDPSTLYIPPKALEEMTEYNRIYWGFKQQHFDKIVCFGTGLWYFVRYYDAEIVGRIIKKPLNLYFGGSGFSIKEKDYYFDLITKNGYKIVVVDQIETSEMMRKRVEEEWKENKKQVLKSEVCKREISHIYSRGTYSNPTAEKDTIFDTQNILVYHFIPETSKFGFTFFDITALKVHVGSFYDDAVLTKFRTLVSRIRPVEVLCAEEFRKSAMTNMLRLSPVSPTFNFIKKRSFASSSECVSLINDHLDFT